VQFPLANFIAATEKVGDCSKEKLTIHARQWPGGVLYHPQLRVAEHQRS
jgi:hypothetical protein